MSKGKEPIFFTQGKGGITEFAFIKDNYNPDDSEIKINSNLEFSFTREINMLKCQYEVSFKQQEITFLKCIAFLDYIFKKDSINQLKNGSSILFPVSLLKHFGTSIIGAMRGVLMAKNQDYGFDVILPPVDLNQIITDPLAVEL